MKKEKETTHAENKHSQLEYLATYCSLSLTDALGIAEMLNTFAAKGWTFHSVTPVPNYFIFYRPKH